MTYLSMPWSPKPASATTLELAARRLAQPRQRLFEQRAPGAEIKSDEARRAEIRAIRKAETVLLEVA